MTDKPEVRTAPFDYGKPIVAEGGENTASAFSVEGADVERLARITTGQTDAPMMPDIIGVAGETVNGSVAAAVEESRSTDTAPAEPQEPRYLDHAKFLELIGKASGNFETALRAIIDAKKRKAERDDWESKNQGFFGKAPRMAKLEDDSWLSTSKSKREEARAKALALAQSAGILALVPTLNQINEMNNMPPQNRTAGAMIMFAEKNRPKDLGPTEQMYIQKKIALTQLAAKLAEQFSSLPEHADQAFNLLFEQKLRRLHGYNFQVLPDESSPNTIVAALRLLVTSLIDAVSDDRCNITDVLKTKLLASLESMKTGSNQEDFHFQLPK